MANNRPAPAPEHNASRIGGSFIKPGTLRAPTTVQIDARPVREGMPDGPVVSNFEGNVDIPVTVSTVPYIVTVNVKSKDYADMVAAFGGDFDAWPGQTVRLSTDPALNKVRVQPVATGATAHQ